MLTKNDLQQIRGIVKEEVEPVKVSVGTLGKIIDAVDQKLSKKIGSIDQKLDRVQEDIAEYLNTLEPRITNVEERVSNIEEHLDFPKPQ